MRRLHPGAAWRVKHFKQMGGKERRTELRDELGVVSLWRHHLDIFRHSLHNSKLRAMQIQRDRGPKD